MEYNKLVELVEEQASTIKDLSDRVVSLEELIKSKPNLTFSPSEPVVFPLDLELPSGKVAHIRDCMAKDIIQVGRISKNQPDLYTAAIISQCVTIDGEKFIAEDVLEKVKAFDYMKLSLFFNQLGFL